MSDKTVSRLGQVNAKGTTTTLFLDVFGGEVFTQFTKKSIFKPRTMNKTIEHGKSASFPVLGRGGANYHTPGNELLGSAVKQNEVEITINGLLVADRYIASIDELMNHWDARQPYSEDIGNALAEKWDSSCARAIINGARASTIVSGMNGGFSIANASMGTDANILAEAIWNAKTEMDERNIPMEDRYCALPAAQYNLLAQHKDSINKDYGGLGWVSRGEIQMLAGFEMLWSNNVPQTDWSGGTETYYGQSVTLPTAEAANYSTVIGCVWHKSAAGTVQLLGLNTEVAWLPDHRAWLLLGEYATGHGYIRPESCGELVTATV